VVEAFQCVGCPFLFVFGFGDLGIAGEEDLPLNSREGFGDNGDRRRFLIFVCDSRK
jgi:hypothetical protein